MTTLSIASVEIPTFDGIELVTSVQFIIQGEDGKSYNGTFYKTQEDAQAYIDGAVHEIEAMTFAKAHFPELTHKGHVGKANLVASYLKWNADGRKVKEVKKAPTPELPITEGAPEAT